MKAASVGLNKILRGSEAMLRSLAGDRVALVMDLDPGLGAVTAESTGIEQIMVNLVVNARDAMPAGGLITIRTRNVQLSAAPSTSPGPFRPGPYAALEVSDTGVGMDEKTRARVFEPFFTTKPAGRGTGLGLAIVYSVVNQFGGYIQADSRPGEGSTFTVFLPSSPEPAAEASPRSDSSPSEHGKGVILLAEDHEPVQRLLVAALRGEGYEVLAAADGAKALDIAASELNRIDLVVTDIEMPAVTGTELMECLWRLSPNMGVVYISGHAELGERVTRNRPNARFIAKPFSPATLIAEVSSLLHKAPHDSAAR